MQSWDEVGVGLIMLNEMKKYNIQVHTCNSDNVTGIKNVELLKYAVNCKENQNAKVKNIWEANNSQ